MLRRLADYIFDNALLLIAGTVTGLLWANLEPGTYGWLRTSACCRSRVSTCTERRRSTA